MASSSGSTSTDQRWVSLTRPAGTHCDIKCVTKLNASQFLITDGSSLQSYNIKSDTWNPLDTTNKNQLSNIRVTSNTQTQSIVVAFSSLDTDMKIKIINMKDNSHKEYELAISSWDQCEEIIDINSVIHIITDIAQHYVWSQGENENKSKRVHTFEEYRQGFIGFALLYMPRKQELLLLGGHECGLRQRTTNNIHKYSLSNGTWSNLSIKLPHKMRDFGCVITKDQRYIFILGGLTQESDMNEIFVLDLTTMSVTKSEKTLPFRGECKAIIMENKEENELLVDGYVKKEMTQNRLNIPYALIKLISIWYSTEYIHVFDNSHLVGRHWKMLIDEIINC